MKQESQLLFFRFRETSGSENQSFSWRSRAIQITIYQSCFYLFIVVMNLIIEYFMISAHWVHSPHISYWLWREIENILMQIISHMTDGNQFLNRGISFSLRKPTRWKIYLRQPQNSLTLLSVKIAADQVINWSSVPLRWIRVWATGKG